MQLKKIGFTTAVFFFLAGVLFIAPQVVLANGAKAGSDKIPPGQAKKMLVEQTIKDVKDKDAKIKEIKAQIDKQKSSAWNKEEHPSVKGLKNAYKNHCRNGAPEWKLEQFRQKIKARGGTVDDIDKIKETKYSIAVDGDSSIKLKFKQSVNIAFLVEDSDAKAVNLPANYEIKLQVSDENSILTAPKDGDKVDMSATKGVSKAINITANEKNEGTATIKAILYDDQGKAIDSDTIRVTVGKAVATTGSLSSRDSDITFISDGSKESNYVAKVGKSIRFDYRIVDQGGEPIGVTEDTNIIWAVKNVGDRDIYINEVENSSAIVKPGEEKKFTEKISAGKDLNTITIKALYATEARISAQIEKDDDNLVGASVFFYDEDNKLVSDSDRTIVGTVKAFSVGENDQDNTQILLYANDDYYYITAIFETVMVEGENIDIPIIGKKSLLEKYLENNMKVQIWLDEYKEGHSRDKDSIKLYLNA